MQVGAVAMVVRRKSGRRRDILFRGLCPQEICREPAISLMSATPATINDKQRHLPISNVLPPIILGFIRVTPLVHHRVCRTLSTVSKMLESLLNNCNFALSIFRNGMLRCTLLCCTKTTSCLLFLSRMDVVRRLNEGPGSFHQKSIGKVQGLRPTSDHSVASTRKASLSLLHPALHLQLSGAIPVGPNKSCTAFVTLANLTYIKL